MRERGRVACQAAKVLAKEMGGSCKKNVVFFRGAIRFAPTARKKDANRELKKEH